MDILSGKLNNIFIRATKVIGLDINYFFKNGVWVLTRYLIIGLCGLAISSGFTRLGTKELFGQYQ